MTDTAATNRRLGWVLGADLDRLLHGGPRLGGRDHGAAAHATRPARQSLLPAVDAERLRHRLRRRDHHRRRARRPVRTAEGLQHRARAVHGRLGGLRPRAEPVRVDRRADGAGARRCGRAAAELDHPDDGVPDRAPRDDRRDLRRSRRSRRRDGTDRRRRGDAGHRLALDLLDQRPDRRRRRAARPSAASRELRRTRAARPRRSRACHRRRRRAGLGAQPRQRRRLVKRRGRGHVGRRDRAACLPSFGGRARCPSRWCRCACLRSGTSRSAT